LDIIGRRYSCRTYVNRPIEAQAREDLSGFLASNGWGPLGSRARFALVAATEQDRASLKGLGTYGFIKGAAGFLVGAVVEAPKDLEDYGYLMERAVLAATAMGLGTCWLGGTFTKSGFARKIGLKPGERIPAVAAAGYPARDGRLREQIRLGMGARDRLAAEEIFFDGGFAAPCGQDAAGPFWDVIQAVRWAPSASNKQPWRIVRQGEQFHFYLQRTKGYGKGSLAFRLLGLCDLQRVDMGIAMCHFDLAARESKLTGHWVVDDPEIPRPGDTVEYTASWRAAP
jgi:nitroreductase